jgi:hypothetical protein
MSLKVHASSFHLCFLTFSANQGRQPQDLVADRLDATHIERHLRGQLLDKRLLVGHILYAHHGRPPLGRKSPDKLDMLGE